MNRDELLTELAMGLAEWPGPDADICALARETGRFILAIGWDGSSDGREPDYVSVTGDFIQIAKHEWLAERERLINKPGWEDAPEWAEWLAQDEDGEWCFFPDQPEMTRRMWSHSVAETGIYVETFCEGGIPAGHDWRQTLEQRPTLTTSLGASEQPYCPMLDSEMETGMKFDTDKPRMDLLLGDMPRALIEVGKVLTFGADKYAPGNWVYVENAEQRYRAAGMRHDLALSMGEQSDSETGLHHLAHEACCVLFRLELALRELEATQ